ncbi:MAG: nitrogen regulation protein NR(I) [Pseudomonadota bacterium]
MNSDEGNGVGSHRDPRRAESRDGFRSAAKQIWIVDDDPSIRWVLERAMSKVGWQPRLFDSGEEVLASLRREQPGVLVSDIRMPGIDGLQLMREVRERYPRLPVIIMTAHSDLDSAVNAFESGAFDYLPKPFDIDEALTLVRRAIDSRAETGGAGEEETEEQTGIIGQSPAMQEVFRAIGRLSRSSITVLITGESGTGKERVAQALHRHSPRANGPFIALNTAAIPKDLLESELFGHERGAFTGAQAQRRGRFEQADGGTLFLDEIGDMPFDLQTRLLRVLQEGEFYRVGGHTPVKVDVRIIAATHQDLAARVRDGLFREDLMHRLNVIRLALPALRERREDIHLLLEHFLKRAARELDTPPKLLTPEVTALLERYDWPGNVRQLENTCRWLTVMASGREVLPSDLPPEILRTGGQPLAVAGEARAVLPAQAPEAWPVLLRRWADARLEAGQRDLLDEAMPMFERVMIESAMAQTRGLKQDAALLLGWGRNTLARKMKELGME